ncbi:hypothetical protein NDU88_006146 [Pleurodeles waltl]|uniref:Uncharacterized protein n=1 Tax=Pleurodeles waltl TaxID=8319 RepID=A0AAV7ULZ3_PLEWA|nr:hypothetical protein NDU88_006146 [Pleurodeles waltl]
MAAAAPGSEPLRSSPSARPLDHARSRRREESGPSRGSRRRAATAAPQKRPAIIYEASPRGALNQASFPVAILAPRLLCRSSNVVFKTCYRFSVKGI